MKRVIVCGSREWTDQAFITRILTQCVDAYGMLHVVAGGQRGADTMAIVAANTLGLTWEEHHADWATHKLAAGPIRNRHMLSLGAFGVLAFKQNFDWTLQHGGTEDMCKIAAKAGLPATVFPAARRVELHPHQPTLFSGGN